MPLGIAVEPPDIEASLRDFLANDGEAHTIAVAESHARVGHLFEHMESPVLLLDPMIRGCPIIGVSCGFERLFLRGRTELHGKSWRVLLEGLDSVLVSTSTLRDVESFCRMARLWNISAMAECIAKQALTRGDGHVIQSRLALRLLFLPEDEGGQRRHGGPRPYIAAALTDVGDSSSAPAEAEAAHAASETTALNAAESLLGRQPVCDADVPGPAFFPRPLSGRCVLLDGGRRGMRREPHEVPRGCLLVGSRPVALKDGSHHFEVMVERKTDFWSARIPFLGFTCTPPAEVLGSGCFLSAAPHGYFVGENVVIGGTGEAWRRLAPEPFRPALRVRPEDHIQHKVLQSGISEYQRKAPITLQPNDVMGVCYAQTEDAMVKKSTIELIVNRKPVFQFTFQGWLPDKPLYPLIDVCFSVYQVSIVDPMQAMWLHAMPDMPGACGG